VKSTLATVEILAKHFTRAVNRRVDELVIHCMQSKEKPGTARQVAIMWQGDEPKSSAHYALDKDEIISCVPEEFVAWAAPGANQEGIHVEFAGKAEQTYQEWFDPYSRDMLRKAIPLFVDICRRYNLPAKFVDADGLVHGERGITTHAEVSKAFKKSSHWDPGPDFPLAWFIGRIRAELLPH